MRPTLAILDGKPEANQPTHLVWATVWAHVLFLSITTAWSNALFQGEGGRIAQV